MFLPFVLLVCIFIVFPSFASFMQSFTPFFTSSLYVTNYDETPELPGRLAVIRLNWRNNRDGGTVAQKIDGGIIEITKLSNNVSRDTGRGTSFNLNPSSDQLQFSTSTILSEQFSPCHFLHLEGELHPARSHLILAANARSGEGEFCRMRIYGGLAIICLVESKKKKKKERNVFPRFWSLRATACTQSGCNIQRRKIPVNNENSCGRGTVKQRSCTLGYDTRLHELVNSNIPL